MKVSTLRSLEFCGKRHAYDESYAWEFVEVMNTDWSSRRMG